MGLTRWDEAELSLNHVLERDPNNTAALRTKAELYLATKRPEEAEKLLKKLPHDPGAVRDLAQLYASSGRTENAEKLLNELIAVDPDDSKSRRLLAGLIAEERPDEALKLTEDAASAEPGQTSDMVSLAELYDRTGQKDMALGKLDEAVNLLGLRGEAEDLDQMNAVLGLYEKAAAALEEEHSTLFAERTAQLGRKLQSAVGRQGAEWSRSGQFAMEEIPLDEEDALSLLDINAMEPIIRINEEEETVFLEDAVENLEDAWTELQDREEEPDYRKGRSSSGMQGRPGGAPSGSDSRDQPAGGPPVHIHLPPQSSLPAQPQVIYQDIRPVTQTSSQPAPDVPTPVPDESTEISVEELDEELLPELDEGMDLEEIVIEEEVLEDVQEEEVPAEDVLEEEEPEEDDQPFLIPDSDALSEDLPETEDTPFIEPDLVFSEEGLEDTAMILEEPKDHPSLAEDFEKTESDDSTKMAEMFKYLSALTDETTGEGRKRLIEDGVPLKFAGLHARLSGEPNLREVAQKYDRRRKERHNIELNEERIRGSLDAFKSLAEAYPSGTVSESLTRKLGKIMSFVGRLKKEEENETEDG
jgi:tetratricopeptide (TPR) repeat protein